LIHIEQEGERERGRGRERERGMERETERERETEKERLTCEDLAHAHKHKLWDLPQYTHSCHIVICMRGLSRPSGGADVGDGE
jgi:hypothetical protein